MSSKSPKGKAPGSFQREYSRSDKVMAMLKPKTGRGSLKALYLTVAISNAIELLSRLLYESLFTIRVAFYPKTAILQRINFFLPYMPKHTRRCSINCIL